MADYFSFVLQIGAFTFSVEVAVIGAGIGAFLYGVDRLLKNVVDKFIVCKMELAKVDTILT